jgi:prepilin-type N-terminal cleavage/methylation domain-containing protein
LFKKAFSLIELLIVVVIIGVIYTLAVTGIKQTANVEEKVTLKNLKGYLKSLPYQKSVRFLCLDDCSSCDIYIDGNLSKEFDGVFDDFLDDSVKTYRYDKQTGMQDVEYDVYFNIENIEESVCFSYEVDSKGVGEQVYVEYQDKIYDYTTYLKDSVVYDSISEALEVKENLYQEVMQ